MIPSNLESKKKRVVFQDIEDKRGKRFSDYQDEFEYLISAESPWTPTRSLPQSFP